MEFIDLSARHYRRYFEEMPSVVPAGVAPIEKTWRQPEAPNYLWGTNDRLPKWTRLTVKEGPSRELMDEAWGHREIVRLACQHYGAGR